MQLEKVALLPSAFCTLPSVMLIPRGTVIYENLATSYVLVEPLVSDLCKEGFSGVVAIALRELDGFIFIANGEVRAVVEKRSQDDQSVAYGSSTVLQLAEKARAERGLLALRSYSNQTAEAVVGRINAQSLYARLSIEFTDAETMLQKLAREAERDWFVEINTDAGISALVSVRGSSFHLIASREGREIEWDAPKSADDPARKELLSACKRAAGTFDVYFIDPLSSTPVVQADFDSLAPDFGETTTALDANETVATGSPVEPLSPHLPERSAAKTRAEELANELSVVSEEFPVAENGDAPVDMTELKRLIGEIAGTIEGAAQAVDRHDGFAMCLRASQLKLADRYPFLDPFGSEFEYLAGEIVFVGDATAEQFVAGLTEALMLAVESLAKTNAYGERFRAYVREDLGKLLERNRTELETYGLDRVISEIGAGGSSIVRQ
jgi:hypothetical protein